MADVADILDSGDLGATAPEAMEDADDAFAAVHTLAHTHLEYDPDVDAYTNKFRRGDDWLEALKSIRRLLKKYHDHSEYLARVWMSRLRVFSSRLLPLLLHFGSDRTMLYEVGKVLVFLTAPLKRRGHVYTAPVTVVDALHAQMREIAQAFVRHPPALLALLSLLQPALDPAVKEKPEGAVAAVDLVLTLLKQLLEVPSGTTPGADAAGGAAAAHTVEDVLLMYEKEGILPVVLSLCRLVDRREFSRVSVVLLDFFYQCFRGLSAQEMHKAAQSESQRSAHPSGATSAGSAASHRASSAVQTPLKAVEVNDSLFRMLSKERMFRAAEERSAGVTRHSRFGTNVFVRELGSSRVVAQPFNISAKSVDDSTAVRRSKLRAAGRRSRDDEHAAQLEAPATDGVAFAAASNGSAQAAAAVLFRLTIALTTDTDIDLSAESDDDDMTSACAFSMLVTALKMKFARDSEDLLPDDYLKYSHVVAVTLGCVRLQRSAKEPTKRSATAEPVIDAKPVAATLDRWSLGRVVSSVEEYLGRKHWPAVQHMTGVIKEVLLFVYALVTSGGPSSMGKSLGMKLLHGLQADGDFLALAPRMLKAWDAGKMQSRFVLDLAEGMHYAVKLLESQGEAPQRKSREERDLVRSAGLLGDLTHPTVIQAYVHCLRNFKLNNPRLNYYLVSMLRRMASLPNDAAGTHPMTQQPFTFRVMLYNVAVLEVASAILDSATMSKTPEHHDTWVWARDFSGKFLEDARENPLLFVEALFWRAEKSANAEVSRHYGILGGDFSHSGGATKRRSKRAQDADDAEAEARRNARRGDDDEPEVQFGDDDMQPRPAPRKRGRAAAGPPARGGHDASDDSVHGASGQQIDACAHTALMIAALGGPSTSENLRELLLGSDGAEPGINELVRRAVATAEAAIADDGDVLTAGRQRMRRAWRRLSDRVGPRSACIGRWLQQSARAALRAASLHDDIAVRGVVLVPVDEDVMDALADAGDAVHDVLRAFGATQPAVEEGSAWWTLPAPLTPAFLTWASDTLSDCML